MNLNFVRGRNSEMDVIFLKGTESDVHDKFFFFFKNWIEERIIHTDRIEFHCTYVSTLPRGALPSCTYLREDKINATAVRALKWQHVSRYMFILSSVTLHWLKYCEVLLYNLSRRECVNWQEKKGGAGGMKRNLRIEARKKKRKGKRKRKDSRCEDLLFFEETWSCLLNSREGISSPRG